MGILSSFRMFRLVPPVLPALAAMALLFPPGLRALDVEDDFDANFRNGALWGRNIRTNSGLLKEAGGRLNYTVTKPAKKNQCKRIFKWGRGPYDADWEIKIDLYNDTTPKKSAVAKRTQINSFGLSVMQCGKGENEVWAEAYAEPYKGPPVIKGFFAVLETDDENVGEVDTDDLAGAGPLEGTLKMSFDSATKVVTASYTLGGPSWTPFASFGVAGSGGNEFSDWGMTANDWFCFDVYGWSQHMRVRRGKMYADNFAGTGLIPPKVTILDPNGGEAVPSGLDSYRIEWFSPAGTANVRLHYSLNGGRTWRAVDPNPIPGTSFDWLVPVPMGNRPKSLVRVTAYDDFDDKIAADRSDRPFTVEVVRLTSPNEGDGPLVGGTQHTVTWTTNRTAAPVDHIVLFRSMNRGRTWRRIDTAADPADDGSFVWTVTPVSRTKKACRMKVVLKDAAGRTVGKDVSDGVFTIQPPP